MAWTTPATFVDSNVLTAAELNTFLRDNMLETMAAKATAPLRHFVTSGPNSIVEREIGRAFVAAKEMTASTSFTDLGTVGPSVTVTTGLVALTLFTITTSCTIANVASHATVAISGATTVPASDNTAIMVRNRVANNETRLSMAEMVGLVPGSNTFTVQYKMGAGEGTFADRELTVWAF